MATRPEDRKAGLRQKGGRVVSDKRSRAAKPRPAKRERQTNAPALLPFRKPTQPGVSKGTRKRRSEVGRAQTRARVRGQRSKAMQALTKLGITDARPKDAKSRRALAKGLDEFRFGRWERRQFLNQVDALRHVGDGPAGPAGPGGKNTISREHAIKILSDKKYARGLLAKHYLPKHSGDYSKAGKAVPDIFRAAVPEAVSLVEKRQGKIKESYANTEPGDLTTAITLLTPAGLPKMIGGKGVRVGGSLIGRALKGGIKGGKGAAAGVRVVTSPEARAGLKLARAGAKLERSVAKVAIRSQPLKRRALLRTFRGARRTGRAGGTAMKVGAAGTLAAAPVSPKMLTEGGYHVPSANLHVAGPVGVPINLVANAAADVLNLPAVAVPSVYVPLRALAQSVTRQSTDPLGKVLSDFAKTDAWAALGAGDIGEFWRRFEEHPVFETLMATGAYAGVGRGAGLALRVPHGVGSRPGIRTPSGQPGAARKYSPNALTQAVQRALDRSGFSSTRRSRVRREAGHLLDYATAAHQVRSMELKGRIGKVLHQIDKTVKGQQLMPVVHMVIERTARPGSFAADLGVLRKSYTDARNAGELLGEDAWAANAARIKAIDEALANPAYAERVTTEAADIFIKSQSENEAALIREAIINEEQAIRRRALPEEVIHGGAVRRSDKEMREQAKTDTAPLRDEVADLKQAERQAERAATRARHRKPLLRRLAGKSKARKAEGVPSVLKARLDSIRTARKAAEKRLAEAVQTAPKKARFERPVSSARPAPLVAAPAPRPAAPAARPTITDALDAGGQTWQPGHVQRGVITSKGEVYTWDAQGTGSVHADYPIDAGKRGASGSVADLDIGPNGEVYVRTGRSAPDETLADYYRETVEAANPAFKVAEVAEGLSSNPVRTLIDFADNGAPPIVPASIPGGLANIPATYGHAKNVNDILARLDHESTATFRADEARQDRISQDIFGADEAPWVSPEEAGPGAKFGSAPGAERVPLLARAPRGPTEKLPLVDRGAGFITAAPTPRFGAGGRPKLRPATLDTKAYTGTRTKAGAIPGTAGHLGYSLLTRTNLLERALFFRDFVKLHTRGKPDGTAWKDKSAAEAARFGLSKAELQAMGVKRAEELVAMRRDAATNLGDAAERFDAALDRGGADLKDMLTIAHGDRSLVEIATVDVPGDWVLAPEYAIERVRAHSAPEKALLSGITRAWKGAILPTSPKWYFGNWFDITMRSLVEGLAPPGLTRADPRFYRGRSLLRAAGPRTEAVFMQGSLFGESPYSKGTRHLDEITRASDGVAGAVARLRHDTPALTPLLDGLAAARDAAFAANARFIETAPKVTMLGKVAKQQLRHTFSKQELAMKGEAAAYADLAAGLRETPAQLAYHREVAAVYGDWIKLRPEARQALVAYAPFYLWLRASTRFVFFTMPHRHPIKAAILAASARASQHEREVLGLDLWHKAESPEGPVEGYLQGGIPTKGGGIKAAANVSSFGVWSDPGANVVHFILPQVSTVLQGGRGLTWNGNQMALTDGTPMPQSLSLLVAVGLAAESFVPFLPLAHRASGLRLPGEYKRRGSVGSRVREQVFPSIVPSFKLPTPLGKLRLGGKTYGKDSIERGRMRRSFERQISVPAEGQGSGGRSGGKLTGGSGGGKLTGGSGGGKL